MPIRASFAKRRETILNNPRAYIPQGRAPQDWPEVHHRAQVDASVRAETLDTHDFFHLSNYLQ